MDVLSRPRAAGLTASIATLLPGLLRAQPAAPAAAADTLAAAADSLAAAPPADPPGWTVWLWALASLAAALLLYRVRR